MAQGEQGGGEPPHEPQEGASGERRIGPSPGAQRAAREQAERSRAAAEERERERERAWQARAAQSQYAQQPPQPQYGPPVQQPQPAGDPQQHPAPPQGWPAWQQRPSQPGHPVPQQPPSYPAQQQPPYPGYPPAGWGQTPYGYAPVPYGYEQPQPWPYPVAQQPRVTAPPHEHPKELPWRLAGWWSRVAAQIIDVLVVWIPAAIVLTTLILIAEGARNGSATETVFIVLASVTTFVALAVHLFYAPLLMKRKGDRNGQTWGKQLCNIRVIRADGKPMAFSHAALRQIIFKSFGMLVAATFVPLFPWILNYLWPTWDEQHRALHDMAADTRVVAA